VKGISLKGRLSKKRLLGATGVVVVLCAAGGYVWQSGLLEDDAVTEATKPSGVACSTTDLIKLNRGGQRWLRKYVRTDSPDGVERVRTALRVAGVLAQAEKADLYQVVVLDNAGPEGRANLRGPAIGAEVLFAPDPTKLPDMPQPFVARYATGKANTIGLFYGERVEMTSDEIRSTLTAMTDRSDCQAMVAEASVPVEGDAASGHGKPADGHGAPAEGEAHAAAEPAEGHGGEKAPEEGGEHAAAAADQGADHASGGEGDGGWMSTVMNLIPGMGKAAEAGSGHEPAAPDGAEPGMMTKVLQMIPGMGGKEITAPEAPATAHGSEPAAPDGGPAEQAAGHAEPTEKEQTAEHQAPDNQPAENHAEGAPAVTVPEPAQEAAHEPVHAPDGAQAKAEPNAEAPHAVTPEETGATH
jgi:hypothetical protein